MAESLRPEVHVFKSHKEASQALAESLVGEVHDAVTKKGRFALALSGGRSPRLLYSLLAGKYSSKIVWDAVHLFWGDERCVPKDHPDSNFAMAYQTFISKVPIPSQNIHRIPAELEPPENAAESYESTLRDFFKGSEEETLQAFDVILLGVGKDGHTASLFPGSPVLVENNRWVVAIDAPSTFSPMRRITVTLPVINLSGIVFFLVSGDGKKDVVRLILDEPERAKKIYPAAMVHPRRKFAWYVEKKD